MADQYYRCRFINWSLITCCRRLFVSDADLLTDKWKGINLTKDDINSMNQVILLTKSTLIEHTPLWEHIYYTNLDLHTTRKLYLHSSVLASYDTLSTFDMDTILKNISVRATYNELIVILVWQALICCMCRVGLFKE